MCRNLLGGQNKDFAMKRLIRTSILLYIAILCVTASCVCTFAIGTDDISAKISDNNGGILSISYRGDTASFPKNSLEAIRSAEKSGADMVSVSVAMTKDGVIVLSENEENNISNLTFEEAEKLFLE